LCSERRDEITGWTTHEYLETDKARLHANMTKEEYESLLPYRMAEELKK
jgi:hypothetical protein